MPELPDVELYIARLDERIRDQPLVDFRAFNAFVVRTFSPTPVDFRDHPVRRVSRLGKRIVFEFGDDQFIVIHLMIAGRLVWNEGQQPMKPALGKIQLAGWAFPTGNLILQEVSTKKRAGIWFCTSLEAHRRDGLDVLTTSDDELTHRLQLQNRTLKRALTDPSSFDGIGNAYSDEILFAARLSPVRTTQHLTPEELTRLWSGARATLSVWRDQLLVRYPKFPKPSDITAFRADFAVHGRYNQPCPVCASPVQRIVYAENETNYCARCQNEGRLLADRSLSRLLKQDWPKTLDDL